MLKLSLDGKTKFRKDQKNTFGLLPGPTCVNGTCPWCTTAKGGCYAIPEGRKLPDCYAARLAAIRPTVRKLLEWNTNLLKDKSIKEMEQKLQKMITLFKVSEPDSSEKYFRIHWSGDIFNRDYAKALANTIKANPDVTFWTYTRSFNLIDEFKDIDNLIFYLSLDPANYKEGFEAFIKHDWYLDPKRKIAYMSKDIDSFKEAIAWAKTEFESNGRFVKWLESTKITNCPVDAGTLELEMGCSKCRQCLKEGNQLLWFKS
jgi:hypothetical protein